MLIFGWCEICRKVRRVHVRGAALAALGRGTPTGICRECTEGWERRRQGR